MSNKFKVLDYDVVYLSYDEPNAEENYSDLLTKIPLIKKKILMNGVKLLGEN